LKNDKKQSKTNSIEQQNNWADAAIPATPRTGPETVAAVLKEKQAVLSMVKEADVVIPEEDVEECAEHLLLFVPLRPQQVCLYRTWNRTFIKQLIN
jgi:hypothetical protein